MVKFLGVAMIILVVSGIFVWFGLFVNELQTNYSDQGITNPQPINESYTEGFDKAAELNDTLSSILPGFTTDLGEGGEDGGSWSIFQGIVAIPSVIITLPSVLFNMFSIGVTLFLTITKLMGIPNQLIVIGMIAIGITLMFMLVRWWRRYEA